MFHVMKDGAATVIGNFDSFLFIGNTLQRSLVISSVNPVEDCHGQPSLKMGLFFFLFSP